MALNFALGQVLDQAFCSMSGFERLMGDFGSVPMVMVLRKRGHRSTSFESEGYRRQCDLVTIEDYYTMVNSTAQWAFVRISRRSRVYLVRQEVV